LRSREGKSRVVTEEQGNGGGVDANCIGEGFVEGGLELAKVGGFTGEEEVREGVDGHSGVPEAVEEGGRAVVKGAEVGGPSDGELVIAMPHALDDEGAVGVVGEALVQDSAQVEEGSGLSDGVVGG
jgi:hypothetical protein